jgi:hypothetical protein
LKINYRDLIVSSESYPSPSVKRDAPLAKQLDLDLQDAIKQLGNEDLAVRILRKDNGRIELQVDVRFGSAS